MTHDVAASVAFLKWLRGDGNWVLSAITPDNKSIETRTFGPETEDDLVEWLDRMAPGHNVYFQVNRTREPVVRKKPEKSEIGVVEFLHVDVDPRERESLADERARIAELLATYAIPPSAIVFSGGGHQAFWRLEEPVTVDGDPVKIAEVERYNRQLEIELADDLKCFNVDRLMRLPGTINLPNATKLRHGRVPAQAELVSGSYTTYALTEFTAAQPVQEDRPGLGAGSVELSGHVNRLASVDELPEGVSDNVKILIVNGHLPDNPGKYPSRSEALWAVLCGLVRAGVDDDTIFGIITDPDFRISGHIIDQGHRAEAYAAKQIGRAKEFAIDPMLAELNERHAVIGDLGGRCRVISELWDEGLSRSRFSKQTFQDIRDRYSHRKVVVGYDKNGNEKKEGAGTWWLGHASRRSYDTMAFVPGRETPPNVLNLWRGFAFDAKPGSCERFFAHTRDNICGGNEEHFNYLLDWCARMIQQPASAGQVAIVFRGEMGVGKGFFARKLGALAGRHFVHLSNSKHLTGNFNYHLRDGLLVFADEAFFAGDKSHASILKAMITENTLVIEPKGVDAEIVPNYIHLVMASNEDWVVPAGLNERRFFVLDVGAGKMQQGEYFDEIDAELEAGGYEALLHHLMTRDISEFDVRDVPKTRALQAQKIMSMSAEEDWWFSKLMDGQILTSHAEWETQVMTKLLTADYIDFTRNFRRSSHGSATRLGQFLRKAVPGLKRIQLGSPITIESGGVREVIPRPWVYKIGTLAECRAKWDKDFGGPYPWTGGTPPKPEQQEHPF